jgi:hypothetical protein
VCSSDLYLILAEIFDGRQTVDFHGKTRSRSVVARAMKSILRIGNSREIGIVSPEFLWLENNGWKAP